MIAKKYLYYLKHGCYIPASVAKVLTGNGLGAS
jgi:hypothetical protein